ncbi:protein of unknown function [Streptomyces zhaozhouensis]|uniref:DUF4279 domain-containing protein n=1 Tax=Streptomyces zhaozhouensis TaxID=1300267 RepID=A0A286DX92_9ACTN|nr:DUF4279 domain-containing protein [Streptomyces zhaozhouensis]SOD63174.1 protein of unknown function [Streptomyces zhaozhouensis]
MEYAQSEYPWTAATATLEVRGDTLEPDVVSTRLGLTPHGKKAPGPDPRGYDGDSAGLWMLDASPWPGKSLAEQLEELSEVVEAHADALRELQDSGCEVRVVAFGFVGGVAHLEISAECVRRLGAQGISLHLDPSSNSR